ncbi:hypothetical protein COU60_02160 [Candidatus Pacearchaeota archaeon CG10_big_fil_rev_8_21_14_0_10_34_76]|nr:MAG: hypothetical protein COU60_02160 [Candidatus Pacearchaeota archaeon CG10_big_fil_rev_8_21_14_0_10_34_76]
MKSIRAFEEYIKIGLVKKIKPNTERAKSLIFESERKMNSLKERIDKIGVKDENSNDYVEYCYDILMLLIRAKLYSKGYNTSGLNAHSAEISYLQVLGFSESDIQFMDKIRYFRNGMLYYGTRLDKEYAEKVIEFTKRNYPKLKQS